MSRFNDFMTIAAGIAFVPMATLETPEKYFYFAFFAAALASAIWEVLK